MELKTEEFSNVFDEEQKQKLAVDEDEEISYVADCTVETDMELYLPQEYVPQESERINLYQELDNMERETDVMAFRTRLEDRFGKIPRQANELIRIVSLRRLARTLGIEKVSLKQNNMYIYFVGDENKAYYESPAFGKILHYLQGDMSRCKLREIKGKRSILIDGVRSVQEAIGILSSMASMTAI